MSAYRQPQPRLCARVLFLHGNSPFQFVEKIEKEGDMRGNTWIFRFVCGHQSSDALSIRREVEVPDAAHQVDEGFRRPLSFLLGNELPLMA